MLEINLLCGYWVSLDLNQWNWNGFSQVNNPWWQRQIQKIPLCWFFWCIEIKLYINSCVQYSRNNISTKRHSRFIITVSNELPVENWFVFITEGLVRFNSHRAILFLPCHPNWQKVCHSHVFYLLDYVCQRWFSGRVLRREPARTHSNSSDSWSM